MLLKCINECLEAPTFLPNFLDKVFMKSKNECNSNICHYKCSVKFGIQNIKYNNKYPFKSIFGADEFFSSFASAMCLYITLRSILIYVPSNRNISKFTQFTCFSNVLMFLVATIYHFKVSIFTRNLDYALAMITIITNFVNQILLIRPINTRNVFFTYFFGTSILFYSLFLRDFVFWRYKIITGIFLFGFIGTLFYNSIRLNDNNGLIFAIGTFIVVLIELSDVPPFFYLLDSHSMYHFISFFIIPFYYKFIGKSYLKKGNKKL